MRSAERRKVNVLEMKCLRSLVGVSRMDRVKNEAVSMRAGMGMELGSREDQRMLRCFEHVERMDKYSMAVIDYITDNLNSISKTDLKQSPTCNLEQLKEFQTISNNFKQFYFHKT